MDFNGTFPNVWHSYLFDRDHSFISEQNGGSGWHCRHGNSKYLLINEGMSDTVSHHRVEVRERIPIGVTIICFLFRKSEYHWGPLCIWFCLENFLFFSFVLLISVLDLISGHINGLFQFTIFMSCSVNVLFNRNIFSVIYIQLMGIRIWLIWIN